MKVEQRKKLDRLNDDGRKETGFTETSVATRNVQSALQPGRMEEIMEEIGKTSVDVVDVQEIGWQGEGRIDKKIFLFSTVDRKK